MPEGTGPFPAVIVIQEWWGLSDHIKDLTDRFAREGFVACAPDLYRGQIAAEPDEARKLAMELEQATAVRDIQSTVDYLLSMEVVGSRVAGVVGFCMGGGLALWMSYRGENLGAVVIFYGGRGRLNDAVADQVRVPILGIFGEADASIPLDDIRANEKVLKENGKIVEMIVFPDAPHAFFNDTRASYRPAAAAQAWTRTLKWFRQYL